MRNEEWWCGASYNESAADYWNHVKCAAPWRRGRPKARDRLPRRGRFLQNGQ